MSTLVALGPFRFGVQSLAFTEMGVETKIDWASQDRMGRAPALQFTGPGPERIKIGGTLYPEVGAGLGQLGLLRAGAKSGMKNILATRAGSVSGPWVIKSVKDKRTYYHPNGSPRKIDFDVELERYGPDGLSTGLGQLLSIFGVL